MVWRFINSDGLYTPSAPDDVAKNILAVEKLPFVVQQSRYVRRDELKGIFHVDGWQDNSVGLDAIARYLNATISIEPIAAAEFMLYSVYDYATSSQRPQKSGAYVRPKRSESDLAAVLLELLAMQVLAATSRGMDFASPSTFADITGMTLSFSLPSATTIVLGFAAKNILYSDAMGSESQIGFNVDGTDYVVGEYKGHTLGTNTYKAACGFLFPLALAAGSHSITPRVKTIDGAVVGSLAGNMAFVALG